MDSNMVDYYQQIGELKKAVRERELHRLELEKQVLQSAQRRERRHEDFKDKIREIQKELAQKEREATHNFQSLLARVDSIRREHQLLAAHTEQLRQRKLQYEMNLRSADPLLHTAVHQDLSGIFKDSDGELWKGHLQANSTPNSKSHLQQPTLPLQHLISPTPSYNNYMSIQPIDQHIPRTKEHHPHGIPMTSSTMQSRSLIEESLPQNRAFSHTQHGNVIKTPSAHNLPSYMDHRIPPHDISRERHPQSGMDLRPHTNVDKTSTIHTRPSTIVDHITPQALRGQPIMSQVFTDPLTYDGIGSQTSGAVSNTITHNQPSPRYYNMTPVSRASETQSQSNATPSTDMHPSPYNISDNASRMVHQNHPPYQPARGEPPDYDRNRNPSAVPTHSSDVLVPNNFSSSTPGNPQMPSYLGDAEVNYLKQLHSSLYPQNPRLTASPKTDRYYSKLDDRFPPGTTNGVSYYSPAISRSETGLENKYMNPSSPPLNNVDPQYETEYDRVRLPADHDPSPHRSNSLVEREVPEKDTASRLSLSSQDLQNDKMHYAIGEDGLTKTRALSDVDEKLKEISTPRKHFDTRTQNDNPTKDETKNYENRDLTISRPFGPIYDENSDKANNNQQTFTSTPPTNTSSSWTPLKEPNNDTRTKMEPSLVSTIRPADSVQQEEYPKTSEVQVSNEKPSSVELKPKVSISSIASRDRNEYKEGMGPVIHQKETKPNEIHPDKHNSSPKYPPFLQTRNDSPEKQISSSKSSPSSPLLQDSTIRSTSVLEPTQDEGRYSDGQSASSKESPFSPPIKMNKEDTTPTSALSSKEPSRNVEDSDTDFFDQNVNVTGSAAYRSLVGDTRKGSVTSENDETERHVAGMISNKPQTPLSRPSFKPFASSIPSLRPAPPETDTDSVDSVEAAIQAAMKSKDQTTAATAADSSGEPSNHKSSSLQPETILENPEVKRGLVQPGTDTAADRKKSSTSAALAINLDSESESYEVSAGGGASDEDDFDFYDKF